MSQRYLLDTNIISHMMRETAGVAVRNFAAATATSPDCAISTSTVVLCELQFGLRRVPNPRLGAALERILAGLEVHPLDQSVVPHYASLRTQMEAAGTPLGSNDTLIAAHALALGATLVSADEAFARVPGLQVENWLR